MHCSLDNDGLGLHWWGCEIDVKLYWIFHCQTLEYSIKFHTEMDPILLFDPGRAFFRQKQMPLLVVQRENGFR